ncbi:hypothetical protein [Candidatus Poriferisodalis sp.]|uniref:hypothetical protein n=1 Tax=Candidatus Poriferisodalis sp. TaxID=3101277 RepID=UPI003C6FBBAA
MSIVAVVLVVAVVLYWRSQVTSSSANAAAGVVVSAGAPPGADIPQVTATGLSLGPAQALSAELPSLEPAAVPLVQKAPAMVPEHESPRDSRAVVETDSGTTAVWSNDEIGPADVESAGEETKEPPPEPQQPTLGQMYTWEDGDRTLEVWRDPNLVVQPDGDVISREDIIATAGDDVVVRGAATEDLRAKGNPVFWSESGELMALPGGAVLVLDPSWDYSAIDAFFGRNGIDAGRLTELDFVTNGYFIETEPGFASLDLANSLAGQDGVELSSPNWWIERVTK